MRSWPPRWPETPVSAVGGDPPGRLPSGGRAREYRPGSGVAHHWSSNAPNATADLVGGHERSTPEWPVSGAEPGCGPTLASNDAARPTLGVATTGGVARAGHDRTQRRGRSLTIDVVGGAAVGSAASSSPPSRGGLVVMGAYPFGLHNRLRLTEQDRIISLRVGNHLVDPLSPRCGASAGDRSGVDRRLLLAAGDLDAPRLGLLGDRDGQPQHPVVVAGLDLVGVEGVAEEQLAAEHSPGPL